MTKSIFLKTKLEQRGREEIKMFYNLFQLNILGVEYMTITIKLNLLNLLINIKKSRKLS